MGWEILIALVIAIAIILFPAAYVWYLNINGIVAAVKKVRATRIAGEKAATEATDIK